MRAIAVAIALLVALPLALAAHEDGKGARSLGGKTIPRGDALFTLETDEFPQKPLGKLEQDASAVGGDAWNLTDYGTITTTIDVPASGVVWFDIRARGWHPPDMMNPHMHILIDGEQRAEWDVRGTWMTYPQSVPMLAGKHTVAIDNFDNYRGATQARVLVADWLSMTKPTLEGVPRVPNGGHVVVDAEDIQNSVTGMLVKTTEARNGTEWQQWGVGCFAELFVFEGTGKHELDARLRGNEHEGVGTRVQVKLDTTEVQEYFVGDERASHKTTLDIAKAGAHLVEICYDNDEPGKKRNLWLDEMSVADVDGPGAGTIVPAPIAAKPWTSAHAGLSNWRHTESGIDATSAPTAREAWRYDAGTVTGTPAVDDGVAYFGDHAGKLHAVKLADGAKVWAVDHGAGIDSSVALDDDHVYAGDQDGWLSARKRADGSLVWRVRADTVEGTHLYGSPVLHAGVLYTGVASEQTLIEYEGEQTFRGSVLAVKASDGSQVWKTYTQSADGKGVSVWSTPAIDPELKMLYVGTGNSYGEPVSQYTDSILALRLGDGSVAWSYQATKNDAFNARGAPGPDRDFGASPLLFEANGRKVVGDGDKGGMFFALDRASGEVVWQAKADFKVEGVPAGQLEGFLGTASYHDGVIYAPTTARSMVHAIDADSGAILWATELNPLPTKYGDRMFAPATAANGVVLQGNAFGRVFALDMESGEILLNASVGGAVQGGIALAGDRFLVPHVGKDLWTGKGGIVAFVVDATAPPVTPTDPTAATPTVDGPAPPAPATVRVLGGFFEPARLEVTRGTTVTWVNEDSMPHTVTSTWDDGATFDAVLKAGETFTHTFAATGDWAVHCRPHTGMEMTVAVLDADPAAVGRGIPGPALAGLLAALGVALLVARRR